MFKLICCLPLLLLFLQSVNVKQYTPEEKAQLRKKIKLNEELNREYRRNVCCKKKLSCCGVKLPNLPNIEIRAILVHCPNARPCAVDCAMRRKYEPICSVREHNIRQFEGFDEDVPLPDYSLTKCRKKLMISIRISKHEFDHDTNHYIIVDHVFDPTGGKYTRIFTPYVIKMKQEPSLQMYELKFLHVVNSKVREKIYNKRSPNYKGCYLNPDNPTCGKLMYNGKVIPYSEGFCCSCDQLTNFIKQPPHLHQYATDLINYGDPSYLLGGLECPHNVRGAENINIARDLVEEEKLEQPNLVDQNANYEREWVSPLKNMKYHNLWENKVSLKGPNSGKNYTVKVYSSNLQAAIESNNENIKKQINQNKSNAHKKYSIKMYPIMKETDNKKKNSGGIPDLNLKGHMSSKVDNNKNRREDIQPSLDYFNDVNSTNNIDDKIRYLKSILNRRKSIYKRLYRRQVQAGGTQRRGGQNCADRWTPKDVNRVAYHESTHCLRFSDLWYTVYHLQPPLVNHAIQIQIFIKHFDQMGLPIWKDVTRNKIIRISSRANKFLSEAKTFSIRYIPEPEDLDPTTFAINYKSALLLIPENIPKSKTNLYPEAKAGAGEYLVVHASQITLEGDQCDVAGVGFEAFVKQANRCSKRRGTCLKNQPYDLWLHDHQAEKLKLRGCFFLKNFGPLPLNPIRRSNLSGEKYLAFEYHKHHSMKFDLEIKSDYNAILRKESTVKITEVYIDCATVGKIVITVKVTNTGLVSSRFMTRLADCPLDLPSLFNNIHSKFATIPPQHQHAYVLEIKCQIPWDSFHCSIEVLTYKFNLAALRRIRFQRFDRCICAWHCLCTCTGSSLGLACTPMSSQHYHAAGFQGSMPVTSYTIHYTFFDDSLMLFTYIACSIIVVLLFLGLCKGLIGLCCFRVVGNFGLGLILNLPKPMKKYHEKKLKNMEVEYDKHGYPINPITKRRVRNVSTATEFCINFIFFFIYPLAVLIKLTKQVFCAHYLREDDMRTYDEGGCDCANTIDETCDCCNAEIIFNYTESDPEKVLRKRSYASRKSKESLKLSTIISIQDEETTSATKTDVSSLTEVTDYEEKEYDEIEAEAENEAETEADDEFEIEAETEHEIEVEAETEIEGEGEVGDEEEKNR